MCNIYSADDDGRLAVVVLMINGLRRFSREAGSQSGIQLEIQSEIQSGKSNWKSNLRNPQIHIKSAL